MPIVFLVMGRMEGEFQTFLKRLSESLYNSWGQQLSVTVTWIRGRVIFALLKSVRLCPHGSCTPWFKNKLIESVCKCIEIEFRNLNELFTKYKLDLTNSL